jgi:hypothetical protein
VRARGPLAAVAVLVALAAAPAVPAVAAGEPSAGLVVAPTAGGVLRAGSALDVDVEITNSGTAALPGGTLRLSLDKYPVASVDTLVGRVSQPDAALLGYLVSTTRSPSIDPGASTTVRVHLSRAVVDSVVGASTGTRVLGAELRAGGRSTFADAAVTRIAKGFTGSIGFGTIVPITAPANETGLVDAATLETLTGPGGAWDDALRAARADPHASVALDPEVLASIRALRSGAPASATGFLTALQALPNETIRLPYADGDVTLEQAAGADAVTGAPKSFGAATATAPSTTASPAPTASATPQPAATALPSTKDLLDWRWSSTGVAWPVAGTVSADALSFLESSDHPIPLLGSRDVADSRARVAAGPRVRVGSSTALVADATASQLLQRAATSTGVEAAAATAELVGLLGTDAVTGDARSVLALPARVAGGGGAGLARVLRTLAAQDWIDGTDLTGLLKGGSTTVRLHEGRVPSARVRTASDLYSAESGVRRIGSTMTQPARITGPERLALLAGLSTAWRGQDREWSTAAADVERRFTTFVGKVHFDQRSPITYVGGAGALPVQVTNELDEPVTVRVKGTTSNGRLRVEGTRDVTVPANAGASVRLPVQSISNGDVRLTLTLTTTHGSPIGRSLTVPITVNAGWEALGAGVLAVAMLALFGTGVYRNVRRARRALRRTA